MTLKEFILQFGFQIDEDSEAQVEGSIDRLKDYATNALSDIGISLSSDSVNALMEQFNAVGDVLGVVNESLSSTLDIQNAINEAVNVCSTAYAAIADAIGNIEPISIDTNGAEELLATAEQLLQVFGAVTEVIASMSGAFDTEGAEKFNALISQSTEPVDALTAALGLARAQFAEVKGLSEETEESLVNAFSEATEALEGLISGFQEFGEVLSSSQSSGYAEGLLFNAEAQDAFTKSIQESIQALNEELAVLGLRDEQFSQEGLSSATDSSQGFIQAKNAEVSAIAESSDASREDALAKYAQAKGTDVATESTSALTAAIRSFLIQAQNVVAVVEDITQEVQEMFNFQGNTEGFESMGDSAKGLQDTLQGLIGTMGTIPYIAESAGSVAETVTATLGTVLSNATATISGVIGSAEGQLNAFTEMVATVTDSIPTELSTAWDSAMDSMRDAGVNMVEEVTSGFDTMVSSFTDSMNAITQTLNSMSTDIGITVTQVAQPQKNAEPPVPSVTDIPAPDMDSQIYQGAVNASANDMSAPMNTLNNQISNITVNQSIVINNTFEGSKEVQKEAHEAMEGAGDDIMEALAKAMAYSR